MTPDHTRPARALLRALLFMALGGLVAAAMAGSCAVGVWGIRSAN